MKERMRLEKEKKNENKGVDPKVQQKRKHPEEDKENQNRKKKKQESTESAKEKEQNAKNKEEKRKKKEQEQERQRMMLEARKAQAASRWVNASTTATTCTDDDEVTIVNDLPSATFTPQPLRRNNSLNRSPMISAHTAYSSTPNTTPESVQTIIQESSVANLALPASSTGTSSRTPNTSIIATPESIQSKHRSSAANLRPTGTKTKRTCEPKRGLHFQSAIAEDSDDEFEEEEEQIPEEADVSSNDCCKEQKMEIKALRKRLEKVHKRLNIACKLPPPKLESSVFSHTRTHIHIHAMAIQNFAHFHQCNVHVRLQIENDLGGGTKSGMYNCSWHLL